MKIKSKILHAAKQFQAPKTDERAYIKGVHIRKGFVEATNSKCFIIMQSDHENWAFEESSMIIDIKKPIPAKAEYTELSPHNNHVILKHFDEKDNLIGADFATKCYGTFPDLNKHIPKKSNGKPQPMPLAMWGLFAKAFKKGNAQLSIATANISKFEFGDEVAKQFGSPVVCVNSMNRNRIC